MVHVSQEIPRSLGGGEGYLLEDSGEADMAEGRRDEAELLDSGDSEIGENFEDEFYRELLERCW